MHVRSHLTIIALFVLIHGAAALAQAPAEPPDPARDYVFVRDGNLYLGDQRIRFWGTVGNFPGRTHADNEAVVRRLKGLGFNMVRYWPGMIEKVTYKAGDGSRADLIDHFLSCLKKEGMRAWCAGFNDLGVAMPKDIGILKDQETDDAWAKAVGERGMRLRGNLARVWDKRLEALAIARMKNVADHKNEHTGLRWADDNVFAVWELSDEEEWFGRMVAGQFQRMPRFFQRGLLRQWNAFLKKKYGSEKKLRDAWLDVLPHESMDEGTILLLPLRDGTEIEGQRAVVGVEAPPDKRLYTMDDFNARRGSDVIEFLLEIWVKHKQAENDAVKPLGRGLTRSPLVWDTGSDYEIQNQFLQQHGDAVAHGTYVTGFHHDPAHKRYPWRSGLEEQPRIGWDKPRLEHNRAPGKPFFCYETQIEQPAKYRAEFPLRLAALGAIQDWDIIIFNGFGNVPDSKDPDAYERAMEYTQAGGNPSGRQFAFDEVQLSAMRGAGEVFRNGLLDPAPRPTRFVFGRRSLLDVRTMVQGNAYGETGDMFVPTTYRYGSRLMIEPGRDGNEIDGPVYRSRAGEPNPVRPTDEIAYDWAQGNLVFDAPGVAAFAGFFAEVGDSYSFRNGVTLEAVQVKNPAGIAYPVDENEKYISFILTSADAKPLEASKRMVLSLVSTSFNSGFKLDLSKLRKEASWNANPGATADRGKAPVLVARVGATITSPHLKGLRYRMIDWHMNEIGAGLIEEDSLAVPIDKPIFFIELERP